ncbi:hypothetical protein J6590_099918, partial [Homalodisca vitripennis]
TALSIFFQEAALPTYSQTATHFGQVNIDFAIFQQTSFCGSLFNLLEKPIH